MNSIKVKKILFIIFLFSFGFNPIVSAANRIDVIVPAYLNPYDDAAYWQELIDTAGNTDLNVKINIIFNPATGPGTTVDLNYYNPQNDSGPLPELRTAGGIIYGYVFTSRGQRSLCDVINDIDMYYVTLYQGLLDGIFLDEMSNDLKDVDYYKYIRSYIKSKYPEADIIGNPGTSYILNTTNQTKYSNEDYVNTVDKLVTFENTGSAYQNFHYPDWLDEFDIDRFIHIIHAQTQWNCCG